MGVFVDAQIAKAFGDMCEKVRSCMVNDPNFLLKESLKGINDSSRGPSGKDFLGPVEFDSGKSPNAKEK